MNIVIYYVQLSCGTRLEVSSSERESDSQWWACLVPVCKHLYYMRFPCVVKQTYLSDEMPTKEPTSAIVQSLPEGGQRYSIKLKYWRGGCFIQRTSSSAVKLTIFKTTVLFMFGIVIINYEQNSIFYYKIMVSTRAIILFTNPSARAGYDTRLIFKRSLTGLNSEFSFS